MDSHDQTGCQAPERPILCINNCGFFGRAATMNMCSKCYKDTLIKLEQEKLAASSIDSIVNGKEPVVPGGALDLPQPGQDLEMGKNKAAAAALVAEPSSGAPPEQQGPSRCATCRKRVGLTGFKCKCGDLFCSSHRYSDKHECPFDYRTAGREAIARANPVVKAEKLDKI